MSKTKETNRGDQSTHPTQKIMAHAPGRINIIGEHTDYNGGLVLPAAIDQKATFQIHANSSSSTAAVTATDLNETFHFDLQNFSPAKDPSWANYIMGVVHELQKTGGPMTGFSAAFSSNVPVGAGMSSSAALECSFAFTLNELFALGLDKWQLIKACQMAEHHFVGIKCGIMDQFASIMGRRGHAMLLDCRSPEYAYIPCDLGDGQFLLLNTNVSHALATSEYNKRRAECEEGVAILQKAGLEISSLRDLTLDLLTDQEAQLPALIYNRCLHVVTENDRVLAAAAALKNKDLATLGRLMYESHFSLRNDYEVSCPELDFLVNATLDDDCVLGSRMMGGGFGGCTINLIKKEEVDAFVEQVSEQYFQAFGKDLTPYSVRIGDGAGLAG
ncbi:MAG: galactokinase [Bacteroidota bacterium]